MTCFGVLDGLSTQHPVWKSACDNVAFSPAVCWLGLCGISPMVHDGIQFLVARESEEAKSETEIMRKQSEDPELAS